MTTPPRRMFVVGFEGNRYDEHAECPGCANAGCVPVDIPVPAETGMQRLGGLAQAVVEAYKHGWTGDHAALRSAMQALDAVLREGETS